VFLLKHHFVWPLVGLEVQLCVC